MISYRTTSVLISASLAAVLGPFACSSSSGGGGGSSGSSSGSYNTTAGNAGGSSSGGATASSSGDVGEEDASTSSSSGSSSSGGGTSSSSGSMASSSSGSTAGSSSSSGAGGSSSGASGGVDSGLMYGGSDPAMCQACMASKCAANVTAISSQPLAIAVANCAIEQKCQGDCCFCKPVTNGKCSQISCTDYALGPCAKEINMAAAGVPSTMCPSAQQMMVTNGCPATNKTNPCGIATAYGDCAAANCATVCGVATCM